MKLSPILLLVYASAITAAPTTCVPQGNGGGVNENGIRNANCCTDVTVVYARGTIEVENVGIIAGPPLFKALRSRIGAGRVTVQGTDYAADYIVSIKAADQTIFQLMIIKGILFGWQ